MVLIVVILHTGLVVWFHWPSWGWGLLALLSWTAALLGSSEPKPMRNSHHADVQAAEKTRLGQILLHRECWMVDHAPLALIFLVVVSGVAALVVRALAGGDWTPILLWTLPGLLAVGALIGASVNVWAFTGPVLALWLIFLGFSLAFGKWDLALKLLASGAGVVSALFSVDLLRGARRDVRRRTRS